MKDQMSPLSIKHNHYMEREERRRRRASTSLDIQAEEQSDIQFFEEKGDEVPSLAEN